MVRDGNSLQNRKKVGCGTAVSEREGTYVRKKVFRGKKGHSPGSFYKGRGS